MSTPIQVSHVKRSPVNQTGIEGLGGTWLDRPWYMSERNLIWEIERPDDRRQWDFLVRVDGKNVPITVVSMDGHKMLACAGEPFALLKLPEWQGPIPAY